MFSKIFIVEHDPSPIQLLTTTLSTAMNKDDILVIPDIDTAFQKITENILAGKKYAAFIDVFWEFERKRGIELAYNLLSCFRRNWSFPQCVITI